MVDIPDRILGLPKKQAFLAGGVGVVIIGIGVVRYRKQQAQSQADAAAAAAAQAPGTGAGSSDQIDPATGFPYGSAEDAAALTAQAGYVSPIGGLGGSDTSYLYGGGPSPAPGGFTSNAQWSQAAEDYLVNVAQGDVHVVGNALGKYITGQPVDDSQSQVINQAIAFEGYPPVSGPDGYPPNIRKAPIVTPPNTKIAVPKVIGMTEAAASQKIADAGLHPHGAPIKPGSSGFTVKHQTPAAGTLVAKGSTVSVS